MTTAERTSWHRLVGRRLLCSGLLLGWSWLGEVIGLPVPAVMAQTAQSQETQSQETKERAALVDGLLDLLNEPPPAAQQTAPMPSRLPPASAGGTAATAKPDLPAHPLQIVQQSMLAAANYLSRGAVTPETTQLQSEIVTRLDELIAELEQSQADDTNPSSAQANRQTRSTQSVEETATANRPQANRPQSAPSEREQGDAQRQAGEAEQNPEGPGQKGKGGGAVVDLSDPQALQQSVWGQLPEQVRKQMQSRMVERFLPSYRQQIEAYFQALLESQANQP